MYTVTLVFRGLNYGVCKLYTSAAAVLGGVFHWFNEIVHVFSFSK